MYDEPVPFNRGAVKPMQALREGWQLIKDQYWLFVGIAFVGTLISGAGPMGILAGPMLCGMYHCVFQRANGREASFNMLFKGFDYFVPCLVPALVMTGTAMVLVGVLYAVFMVGLFAIIGTMAPRGQGQPETAFAVALIVLYVVFFLVLMVIILTLRAVFLFAFPLVMDRGLSGWDAVKLSMRATWANLGGVVGVLLLIEGLSLISSLLCCIGPILELPVNVAMLAVAYRQVFPQRDALAGFDQYDERDDEPAGGGAVSKDTGIQSEEAERNP